MEKDIDKELQQATIAQQIYNTMKQHKAAQQLQDYCYATDCKKCMFCKDDHCIIGVPCHWGLRDI